MTHKILTASSASDLSKFVSTHIKEGFKPLGGHQVVTKMVNITYAGNQPKAHMYTNEYSQTVIKE